MEARWGYAHPGTTAALAFRIRAGPLHFPGWSQRHGNSAFEMSSETLTFSAFSLTLHMAGAGTVSAAAGKAEREDRKGDERWTGGNHLLIY